MQSHVRAVVTIAGLAAAVAGCSDSLPTDPVKEDATTFFARLGLNHKAIVLSVHAPYDTVRLRAAALNLYGDTLSHSTPATFRRLNLLDNSVSVDSEGLVRARTATSITRVIISLRLDGVERIDTAMIMVRNELPVQKIASVDLAPPVTDSAWRWAGGSAFPNLNGWTRFFDSGGNVIANARALFVFSSSNPAVYVFGGSIPSYINSPFENRILGETWLRVKLFAYDTALTDSVLFRTIEPTLKIVTIDRVVPANGPPTIVFYPSKVEINPGTTVLFMNRQGTGDLPEKTNVYPGHRIVRATDRGDHIFEWVDSTGIVFDDPSKALAGDSYGRLQVSGHLEPSYPADGGAGNIASFSWVACAPKVSTNTVPCSPYPASSVVGSVKRIVDIGYRSRKFTTPGTYQFSSTAFPGVTGTIVVKAP